MLERTVAGAVLSLAVVLVPVAVTAQDGPDAAARGEAGAAGAPAATAGEAAELERPEIAARNALFEALDRSNEGYITQAEARANPDLAREFDQLDQDGDGRISRAEFAAFDTDEIAAPAAGDVAPAGPGQQDVTAPAADAGPQQAQQPDRQHQAPPGQPQQQLPPRPGEGAGLEEPAPNVLILRAEVAAMAYETVDAMETHTTIPMAEPVGWAVFSAVPLGEELAPGTGMARHERGEEFYLFMSGVPHSDEVVRYVLAFDDEGLFRDFRQGQLDGPTLERARAGGFMEAYRVTIADRLQVEPVPIADFTFELDGELERALIGVPSVTGEIVDPADPWTWDR